MNFNFKDYLPNSEERIGHLRKIINKRPVAVLAAGPSIKELEYRIGELRHVDICYVGMNSFFVQEKYILQQINKHFSICFGVHMFECNNDFLNRDEDNMYISVPGSCDRFFGRHDKKLLYINVTYDTTVPNNDYPLHFHISNTLSVLIQLMIIGNSSKIILFGADGGHHDGTTLYYRQDEYLSSPLHSLINDTEHFNPTINILIKNTYNTYNIPHVDIFNCSEKSLYTAFPKISYDNAFDILKNK